MDDSKKPRLFITRGIPKEDLHRLKEYCDVTMSPSEETIDSETFRRAVVGMDALYIYPTVRIDAAILDAAGPQLKVIASSSAGLDHIDIEECRKRGIKVGYCGNVGTVAVAEMAITLTMAVARRLEEGIQAVRDDVWGTRWDNYLWMTGKQIYGSVIGIVGLGRIGQAVAARLKAFQPSRIVYCGRQAKPEAAEFEAEFLPFDDVLAASDFIIATCSINVSTKGLFNAGAFRKMKPSAVFINVTRGALVDQEALYEALATGQIGAAGLDVTTPEPLPSDHKLLTLPNCLVTPHLGTAVVATRRAMSALTVDNILSGLNGQTLPSPAY